MHYKEITMIDLLTICPPTKLLYYWLYFLCCTLHSCDLLIVRMEVCISISFTYSIYPSAPSPLATSYCSLYLCLCFYVMFACFLQISCISEIICICLSLSDAFHLARYCLRPSVLLQRAGLHSLMAEQYFIVYMYVTPLSTLFVCF